MKIAVRGLIRNEKGQLNVVLILLIIGGLIITPLLGLMTTGLLTGEAYEDTMHALYAADAGVEDALWRIKNVELADFLGDYDEYDYYRQWPYSLNQSVNDYSVNYTIENVWIPKDIPAPNPDTAKWTIEQGTVIIAGNPPLAGGSQYEIKISYNQSCGYFVNAVGIWLPTGFEYVVGSGDLEKASGEPYYCEPDIDPYKGGYAVVWNFAPPVAIAGFPNSIKFDFTPEDQSPDNAVSWISYSTGDDDITAWDADVKVYKISSTATDPDTGKQTTVESYTSRIELRKLGSAISGDYHAIGNTLMTATGNEQYRDRLFKESSAEVASDDIPSTATIQGAWLYWSGWIESGAEGGGAEEVYSEDCHDFSDWLYGSHWSVDPPYGGGDKEFEGQGGGSDDDRTLTMHIGGKPTHSLDLSPYSGREVTISWQQREEQSGSGWPTPRLESGDCLKYAFSGNGGTSWSAWNTAFCDDDPSHSFSDTIPPEYVTNNFKMRFLLDFDESNEYCYIDDITISASPAGGTVVEGARVNTVMFNGEQVTADQWQIAPTPDSGAPDSWCYSCFCDVTNLVNQSIEDGDIASNGAGTYTVGHVLEGSGYSLYPSGTTGYPLGTPALCTGWGCMQYQWSYAGWSLIIIYSSPETKGHQLYLFDDLHYVAVSITLDFPIRGFLVPDPVEGELYAAHMTCFVGDGDEHYPGDFIALNAPSVPSDEIPDSYKLWDGITVPSIRTPWSRQYFPNNASSPNNVWNSQSPGLTANGVDVDNFDITWSSGLLEPGDTTAEVSLGNASSDERDAELIMVVYIIISFRSETTSGGVIGYLIK